VDDHQRQLALQPIERIRVVDDRRGADDDRGEAIRFALKLARPGDIVLACGKGHEQSMCFGAKEFLWDDRTAIRAALSEFLGMDGSKMPYLPTQDMEEKEWLILK